MAVSNERERIILTATADAHKYGLDAGIFIRQLNAESGLNPNVGSSSAGARGIAQFEPGTAKQWGVDLNDGRWQDDVDGAARLMAHNLKKFGNYRDALIAYNGGDGAVGHPPAESIAYANKILHGTNPSAAGVTGGAPASSGIGKADLLGGLVRVGLVAAGAGLAGLGLARMVGVRNPGALGKQGAGGKATGGKGGS